MTTATDRVVVVGAGLVGLAVAHRLTCSGHEVVVLDKEDHVAAHQSGHSSGVVHSGIYYHPGSLKARLCRRGVELLREHCAEHRITYREIGKVIVARDASELGRLQDLGDRAHANGVPGVRSLGPAELREIEPHVVGVAALHSPTTAIVDYPAVARSLAALIERSGGRVHLRQTVTTITPGWRGASVRTGSDVVECGQVVICAGLQSDLLARAAGDVQSPAIVPFRGDYYRLVPERSSLVCGLVYPVPDPAYPFLGVHFTPRVDGTVDIGPNAVLATAREGYRRRDVDLRHLCYIASLPGSRTLVRQHWRTGLHEMRGSWSTKAYLNGARAYLPELSRADVVRAGTGVRAQAVDRDGTLVDDFRISRIGPVTAVRNAPSPGATSALAIAEHIASRVDGHRAGPLTSP
jgi:L-2-hydroxyglutarate oxidase LhgO